MDRETSCVEEAIFDQPDLVRAGDDAGPEATIYNGTATRVGKYWNVTVQGLPDGLAASAQGATWPEAESNTMDRVQSLFPPERQPWVGIRLIPADPQAADALMGVWTARGNRDRAEQAERDAVRNAIRTMLDQGWSTRDVGKAVGLSHQRVSQLDPRRNTD